MFVLYIILIHKKINKKIKKKKKEMSQQTEPGEELHSTMQQDRSSPSTTKEDFPRHSTPREDHPGISQLERSPTAKTRELNTCYN